MNIYVCNFTDEADRNAISELINAYIRDEYGGGEPLTGQQQRQLPEMLEKHPGAIVLLAETDGIHCGILVAFENISTFTVRPMINIHDVFVRQTHRGRGTGKKLMQAIADIARKRGCSRITLEVRQDNTSAQNLYKNMGFEDTDPPMFYWRKYITY